MIHRRQFVRMAAAIGGGFYSTAHLKAFAWAEELPKNVRIVRVVGCDLPLTRVKILGKNAVKGVHGERASDSMLRVFTNAGTEGFGSCRVGKDDAAALLGRNPADFFRADERKMTGPLAADTMPLWDLAGKLLKQPVYKLLGGAGTERVPVYDGSIYFADLLPQYADRWADRFKQEIDDGIKGGHTAFKIKIGRGNKWMPRAAGDDRDVEVVELIRRHAGPDVLLGVDANNGYDLAIAKRFVDRTASSKLAFLEEPFEERVAKCLELKRYFADKKLPMLLADGESQRTLEPFKPLVEAKALDILQGDIRQFGIEGILAEAALARPNGIRVAPHNFGSLLGYYLQLHIGKSIPNFYLAEQDPLNTDMLVADGYKLDHGAATVPDAPGFGLAIDETKFATSVKVRFDLREQ